MSMLYLSYTQPPLLVDNQIQPEPAKNKPFPELISNTNTFSIDLTVTTSYDFMLTNDLNLASLYTD